MDIEDIFSRCTNANAGFSCRRKKFNSLVNLNNLSIGIARSKEFQVPS